jgi:type II secretory pathway pseudopilin PulG
MKKSKHSGFTLTELLVIIGLISVLISMILPAIQYARAASDKVICQNNLRQIAIAVHHFHNDYKHVPKPPIKLATWQSDPPALLSHLTYLLPYIENDTSFQKAILACTSGKRPWINPPHEGISLLVKNYTCPADSRLAQVMTDIDGISAAYGSYLPCSGSGLANGIGLFGSRYPFRGASFSSVTDGLSNTIMLGERPPPDTLQAGKWYPHQTTSLGHYRELIGPDDSLLMHEPGVFGDPCGDQFWYGPGRTDNPCDRYHFWSLHARGSFFAFGDASVHWIPYSTPREILIGLATRSGGEVVVVPE